MFNAKQIIGKRVAKVDTYISKAPTSGRAQVLERIIFDDGSFMYFRVLETEGEGYLISPAYLPAPPKARTPTNEA